ncbi:MAG TPA: hypothetical protein VFU81_04610, partial [Thermomicrobiales bacterium]|nr:hypothetical protein [Thermomicrobiales bacterium]
GQQQRGEDEDKSPLAHGDTLHGSVTADRRGVAAGRRSFRHAAVTRAEDEIFPVPARRRPTAGARFDRAAFAWPTPACLI